MKITVPHNAIMTSSKDLYYNKFIVFQIIFKPAILYQHISLGDVFAQFRVAQHFTFVLASSGFFRYSLHLITILIDLFIENPCTFFFNRSEKLTRLIQLVEAIHKDINSFLNMKLSDVSDCIEAFR